MNDSRPTHRSHSLTLVHLSPLQPFCLFSSHGQPASAPLTLLLLLYTHNFDTSTQLCRPQDVVNNMMTLRLQRFPLKKLQMDVFISHNNANGRKMYLKQPNICYCSIIYMNSNEGRCRAVSVKHLKASCHRSIFVLVHTLYISPDSRQPLRFKQYWWRQKFLKFKLKGWNSCSVFAFLNWHDDTFTPNTSSHIQSSSKSRNLTSESKIIPFFLDIFIFSQSGIISQSWH